MHNTQFNPYLLPQFVAPQTYVPPYTAPGNCPPTPPCNLRWSPQEMQSLVRQDFVAPAPAYYAPSPMPAVSFAPPAPQAPVRPQPQLVTASGEEYFMGAETQAVPTSRIPTSETASSRRPAPAPTTEHALVAEVRTLKEQALAPASSTSSTGPRTFRSRVGEGLRQWVHGKEKQAEGFGNILVGTSKTVLHTPLTLLEGFGRGAIAITGGQVTYAGKSPAHRLGEGVAQFGKGTGQVIQGSSESTQGLGKAVIYAPLATLEVGARGVGLVAGATVAAGHYAAQGVQWAGRQVADSSIGHEFTAGFRTIIPRKN